MAIDFITILDVELNTILKTYKIESKISDYFRSNLKKRANNIYRVL